ncbi:hypothetical protein B0H14DRAFT_2603779 [Mycena olivaceomarginata]|nr:hypothetical protein B0H14DRAFT_2603779 [Mycena olivaceomarginata]
MWLLDGFTSVNPIVNHKRIQSKSTPESTSKFALTSPIVMPPSSSFNLQLGTLRKGNRLQSKNKGLQKDAGRPEKAFRSVKICQDADRGTFAAGENRHHARSMGNIMPGPSQCFHATGKPRLIDYNIANLEKPTLITVGRKDSEVALPFAIWWPRAVSWTQGLELMLHIQAIANGEIEL